MVAPNGNPAFPASLKVDYPEKKLNRLTSFFRLLWVIPILIVIGLLSGGSGSNSMSHHDWGWTMSGVTIFFPLVLMLLFRKKYPKWWFDWNLAFTRFSNRVAAYFLLLRDEYPSTDEEQAVHLELTYPDAQTQLMRGMPLVKWFLAIPHYIVLFFLGIAEIFVWIIAWFAILFTGSYPRSLFDYTVGVMRWGLRVSAYAILLTTDQYPPFSLD
jgi:Domain of unknown function (DUF4389)